MKRLLLIAGLAIAALGFSAGPVLANNGSGAGTAFAASYGLPASDGGTTTWTCSGAHVVNKVSFKDSETCIISGDLTGYVAGTFSGNPLGYFPPLFPLFGLVPWFSDFPGENGATATSWTATVTANADGTFTQNIVAYYTS
jgi:hypothetical protein